MNHDNCSPPFPGTLDTSFGGDGVVTFPFSIPSTNPDHADHRGYGPLDVAVQPDGKVVFVGGVLYNHLSGPQSDILVGRLNADGTLDTSFGADGTGLIVLTYDGDDRANALALQADGKILIAGRTNSVHVGL